MNKGWLVLLFGALCWPVPRMAGAEIPDRPEKLTFAPLVFTPPRAADYRVTLKSGPVAYVAVDRELPLVNISIFVRTGDYLDPTNKPGVAEMVGWLLSRGGTRAKTAEALEERLAFLAARLETAIGDTQGTVSLNLLSKDLNEGLTLLRQVLTTPRFQQNRLDLRKQQMLQAMKQRNDDSADIEARERSNLAYGDKFFVNHLPTGASVNAITRTDLEAFHRAWFHPSNFVVAVSGDFDRDDMLARLETLFGDWPFAGQVAPLPPANTTRPVPGVYLVDKDVNQGRVSILLPGIMRQDPDYLASQVMNYILGGGGFTSRIMTRVRSDEGLAYSAGSSMGGGVFYSGIFAAGFQTKSRTVAYASSIVLQEIKRLADEPVSEAELNVARRYFIDTFPRAFASRREVVSALAMEEFTGRYQSDPDWFKNYQARFGAVTVGEVQRVAKRFLKPSEVVILVVGQKEEILKGHPDHPEQLLKLVPGSLTQLPLRDPLTLEPLTK